MVSKKDLVILKTKVDYLNVDKLKTFPAELSKLSNVVDSDIVKKTVYDKLFTKVNIIDTKIPSTGGLVTKAQFNSDKQDLENKIEDID